MHSNKFCPLWDGMADLFVVMGLIFVFLFIIFGALSQVKRAVHGLWNYDEMQIISAATKALQREFQYPKEAICFLSVMLDPLLISNILPQSSFASVDILAQLHSQWKYKLAERKEKGPKLIFLYANRKETESYFCHLGWSSFSCTSSNDTMVIICSPNNIINIFIFASRDCLKNLTSVNKVIPERLNDEPRHHSKCIVLGV